MIHMRLLYDLAKVIEILTDKEIEASSNTR